MPFTPIHRGTDLMRDGGQKVPFGPGGLNRSSIRCVQPFEMLESRCLGELELELNPTAVTNR
jgi:hypothetical protein